MHQIGSGALGPVYGARLSPGGPASRGRLFALKAFHVDLTPEQTIVFDKALHGIVDRGAPHAAVVSPVDAGVADGVPYLAYEHVEAKSLDVRRAPPAVEAALPFVVQLAAAVDAAHGQGLVHGALHLRDVLVTPEMARVGGFGVVSALDQVGLRGPLRPPYAAPEQVAGADWGAAADRYALAAVAWELLTGRRAAPAGGPLAGGLERVVDADAAPRLMRLFEAALAADPERRPPSAGRFADELAGALGWTGAAGIRRALAGVGGGGKESGGGRVPERVFGDSPVAVGGEAPAGGQPSADAVGGSVMRRRRKRTPGRQQPENDLPTPGLDFEPLGGSPAGEGPVPADSGVDPLDVIMDGGAARPDAGGDLELRPGADALDDVAAGLDAGLRSGGGVGRGFDEGAADRDEDGYAPISVRDLESRVDDAADFPVPPADPGTESGRRYDAGDAAVREGADLEPPYDAGHAPVREGADPEPPYDAGDIARGGVDLERRYDAGHASVREGVDPERRYDAGRASAREGVDSEPYDAGDIAGHEGVDPEPYDAGDVAVRGGVELEPPYDAGHAPVREGVDLEPYDAGDIAVHEGVDPERPYDAGAVAARAGVGPEHDELAPPASEAQEAGGVDAVDAGRGDAVEDGDGFALTPEEGYDYGMDDDAEPEDPAGEIFDRGGGGEPSRRLPVALVAVLGVAVAVTAFVVGLGWMGGDGDPAADGAAGTASEDDAARTFSEAVVGGSAPEPAASEDAGGVENPESAASPEVGSAPPSAASPPPASAAPPPASAAPSPASRAESPAAAPPRAATPLPAVPRPAPPPVRTSAPPPSAAPPPPPPAEVPPVGRLLVRSMPPGAEVVVNGEPRGTTPMALLELPYGPYEVEVSLAGYGSRRTRIVIDEDDPIGTFSAELAAEPAEPSAARPPSAGAPPGAEVGVGSIFVGAPPTGPAARVVQARLTPSLDDAAR